MKKAVITYCGEWNYKPEADRVSAEIENAIGIKPEIVKSRGGVFDVKVDEKIIFSKSNVFRFPKPGEISELLNNT